MNKFGIRYLGTDFLAQFLDVAVYGAITDHTPVRIDFVDTSGAAARSSRPGGR
jgi:hypothetical protein